jgi:hypothetical protein
MMSIDEACERLDAMDVLTSESTLGHIADVVCCSVAYACAGALDLSEDFLVERSAKVALDGARVDPWMRGQIVRAVEAEVRRVRMAVAS